MEMLPVPVIAGCGFLLFLLMVEFYHYLGRHITVDLESIDGDAIPVTVDGSDAEESFSSPLTDENRFVRNWIITHTDFDGFTSGALLLRLLGKDAAIQFSSPGALLRNLKKVGTGLMAGDTITIADLALQPHQEHDFADVLNQLRHRGVKIIWIDHHEWPRGLIERLESICHELEVDTSEKTAAALIRKRLPHDDVHAERLLRFVQNRSVEEDQEWDRIWRYALSELSQRRDPELSDRILRSWADNEKGNLLRTYLARQGYKREKATEAIASHEHRRVKTNHGRTFLVIDVRPRRLEQNNAGKMLYVIYGNQPSMMVGRQACENHNADFCLIIWNDFRYSVYRGLDKDLDLHNLLGNHTMGNLLVRIGGHRYAVSVKVNPGLKNRLKAMFRFGIGPETEQFIELLRENY